MTKDYVKKVLDDVIARVSGTDIGRGHRGIKYIEKREWQAGYLAALRDVRKKFCGE